MNQPLHIIYLRPTAGFRTELRSDTLWGIVCWGIRLLYGEAELEDFLHKCASGAPEFTISSAFPFKQYGKDKIHFLPKPIRAKLEIKKQKEIGAKKDKEGRVLNSLAKKYKAQYVELSSFNKILKNELSESDLFEKYLVEEKEGETNQTKYQSNPPRFQVESYTHNTINRITGTTLKKMRDDGSEVAGQLFHAEETFLIDEFREKENEDSQHTGLYFLVRGDLQKLNSVLKYYRVHGWGGDRFTGKGTFEAEITEAPDQFLAEPSDANASVCLSLLHPNDADLSFLENNDSNILQYKLIRRQGKTGFFKSHRVKTVLLHFEEGSVFPKNNDAKHWGQVLKVNQYKVDRNGKIDYDRPDLSDGYELYHNGLGFMVNLKI